MRNEDTEYLELDAARAFGCAGPWTRQRVGQGLLQLKRRSAGTELVRLTGELPLWLLCASAAALAPAALCLDAADRVGLHRLVCTPFPIDAGGSDCGLSVELQEYGDRALAVVRTDLSRFDFLRFDSIVVPPVTPGVHLTVCGQLPPPVAVSLVVSYAPEAASIWVPDGGEGDVCVFSRCLEYAPGDRAIHKIQPERRGQYG